MSEDNEPLVFGPGHPVAADGETLCIHEWRGSGPPHLHVHHQDDEAWHVLEGRLRFRFLHGEVEAGPGQTVVVPAGVAHSYEAVDARYLLVLTPRLRRLIAELQGNRDRSRDPEIYASHHSELVTPPPHPPD